MTGPVEWRYTHETSRLLRGGWDAVAGVLGGMAVLAFALVALLVARLVLAGNVAALALVALFLLVGGPVSLLYLAPMLADPDQRPSLPAGTPLVAFSPGRLALASVAGAGVLAGSAAVADRLPMALFAATALVVVPAIAALSTTGELDPGMGTLTVNGRSADLADLDGVHAIRIGGLVLAWLSYARGTATGTPRFVAIPEPVYRDLEPHLRAGVRAEATSQDPLARQVRVALVAFGLAILAVALGSVYLGIVRPDGGVVFLYGAAFAGLFGSLFVWLGAT